MLVARPDPALSTTVTRRRRVHRVDPGPGAAGLTRLGGDLLVTAAAPRLLTPLRTTGQAAVADGPPDDAPPPALDAAFVLDGAWWGLRLADDPLLLHVADPAAPEPTPLPAADLAAALRRVIGRCSHGLRLVGAAVLGRRVVLVHAGAPGQPHALLSLPARGLSRWRAAVDALDPTAAPPEVLAVQPLLLPSPDGAGWTPRAACRLGHDLALLCDDARGRLALAVLTPGRARLTPLDAPADAVPCGLAADPYLPGRLRALVRVGGIGVPELWTVAVDDAQLALAG
jgi:hypothetical protein